jgi:uncharacterized protein (TIGR03067 family)
MEYRRENPDAKEAERLQGDWSCQSAERDGKPLPGATVKKLRLVLTAEKYSTYRGQDTLFEGTYKLDTAKKPAEIDIVATEGESKGQTAKGIYHVDGDTLKLCYGAPGKDRPKEFKAESESGVTLAVWKRAKP